VIYLYMERLQSYLRGEKRAAAGGAHEASASI
jgi:hypothetical protein